ncbi:MAG: MgtC/SapB family protein [Chloroflexota bacterium]
MSAQLSDLAVLLDIVIALVLGGAIGWERERRGKSAGLRTHMLVAMGAALFVALGEHIIRQFGGQGESIRVDPLRIIEAIVTGISFLGAGTIFVSRGADHVQGLTTAASIWATAAIGIAVGLERHVLAVGSTLLVLLVLHLLPLVFTDHDDEAEARSSSESQP